MKIVILTTQTPHHAYFVQEVGKLFPLELVILERDALMPPFDVHHSFEERRDAYEREQFFNGLDRQMADLAPTESVASVNTRDSLRHIDRIGPDVIISFGTGKISKEVIARCPMGVVNLHGGDPQEYRGLDSHLWAIYHKDYKNLITTLHRLNERFDDGEIIFQTSLPIKPHMRLHELRRYNTEACVELSLAALQHFERYGRFIARAQYKQGRYYSFMPAPLKQICQEQFERYTQNLQI